MIGLLALSLLQNYDFTRMTTDLTFKRYCSIVYIIYGRLGIDVLTAFLILSCKKCCILILANNAFDHWAVAIDDQ